MMQYQPGGRSWPWARQSAGVPILQLRSLGSHPPRSHLLPSAFLPLMSHEHPISWVTVTIFSLDTHMGTCPPWSAAVLPSTLSYPDLSFPSALTL